MEKIDALINTAKVELRQLLLENAKDFFEKYNLVEDEKLTIGNSSVAFSNRHCIIHFSQGFSHHIDSNLYFIVEDDMFETELTYFLGMSMEAYRQYFKSLYNTYILKNGKEYTNPHDYDLLRKGEIYACCKSIEFLDIFLDGTITVEAYQEWDDFVKNTNGGNYISYIEFQQHERRRKAKLNLKNTALKSVKKLQAEYGFTLNTTLFEENENILVLENSYCIVMYCSGVNGSPNLSNLPFILKNSRHISAKIECYNDLELYFLGLSVEKAKSYQKNIPKFHFNKPQKYVEELILHRIEYDLSFRLPFITGQYKFEEYVEWKAFIEKNYNFDEADKHQLPSYELFLQMNLKK